jgi:uncharacterized protein YkwD
MTNHRRSPRNGVAGPLLASLSALVLLMGIGWFVVRDTGSSKVTSQDSPVADVTATDDAPAKATRTSPTSPSSTPRRTTPTPTPSPTRTTTKSPTPRPTRTTQPSRGSTRTPTPSPRPTRTSTPTPTKTTKPVGGSGTAESQVLALTNQERAKAGCGPLRTNKALTNAAEAHAADMVDQHYFAHDSLDGRSPFDRMKAAGFRGGAMAENIAAGYSSPAAVVEGWMNSPGHRANILNCTYTMIGIGYDSGQVQSGMNGSWVQDFGG